MRPGTSSVLTICFRLLFVCDAVEVGAENALTPVANKETHKDCFANRFILNILWENRPQPRYVEQSVLCTYDGLLLTSPRLLAKRKNVWRLSQVVAFNDVNKKCDRVFIGDGHELALPHTRDSQRGFP